MITDCFDRWSYTYERSALQPAYLAAHDAVLRRARLLARRPRRILDVGCGTGRLLRLSAEHFPESVLVGLDPSAGMLAIAGATGPDRLAPVRAAAERLPFADGTFDLVVSTAAVRHWADHRAAMREIRRILTPDGLLGLADLTGGGARRRGRGRGAPPPAFGNALETAGPRTLSADTVDGFGPVAAITVVLAARCSRGSPGRAPRAG